MRQQMIVRRENRNPMMNKKLTHHRRGNSWLSDYIESDSAYDESENKHNSKCVTHRLKRRGNGSSSSGNV